MRLLALSGALALLSSGVVAQLESNEAGKAQELCTNELQELCDKRSHANHNPSVLLDVPDGCGGEKSACPVAFFLHGKGFPNMKHQGKMFLSGPHEASSWVHSYHFIGVYPTSDFGWNTDGDLDGDKCTYKQYNCTADNNDVQFIWDIAAWLASKGSTGRVYAYGATDGAALAQKLAANSGNNGGLINGLIISGIWASGGQLLSAPEQSGPRGLYNQPSTVQPRNTPPVAQATSHGDEDQVVPYEGGKSQLHKNCPECTFMSEERSAAVWAKHNGCDMSTPVETQWYECTFGSQKNNTKGWGKRQFYQCPETAPVEFWQIQGAPRGDAETFSITFKDANHTKIEKVVEFFVRVEKASLPPPAPPPSIGKRIEDWASEELPYTMVTVIAAAVCCVCMCMGGLCSK